MSSIRSWFVEPALNRTTLDELSRLQDAVFGQLRTAGHLSSRSRKSLNPKKVEVAAYLRFSESEEKQ